MTSHNKTFQIGLSDISPKIYERDKNGEYSVPIQDWV